MSTNKETVVQDDDGLARERDLLASLIDKLKCEIDDSKNRNKFLESSNKTLVDNLKREIKDCKTKNQSLESSNNHFKEANNELSNINDLMFKDLKKYQAELDRYNDVNYASMVEIDCEKAKGDLMKYYYANHMNAILGVYTTLDESTDLQCEYVDKVVKCERLEKELSKKQIKNDKAFKENHSNAFLKEHEQYFEIQDLKAQLQDKNIALCELKKIYEKLKGKSVETKFDKPSVIRQPNAFKSQRQSVLGMYKVHTRPDQSKTPQLPQDIRKTNKRVSFFIGVIPTTSASRPQLKSNQLEDRVMPNNSQGKKQEIEDHRRNFKFSNNKTSVTACNDNLNAKTSNVNFVCVTRGKCVLNDNHDMCVLHYINGVNSRAKQPIVVSISTREPKRIMNQSVATSIKKTVALASTNQKPRSKIRK
ncbi:hypothetical protein Tco_0595045 [Tanacetum coccineum]